MKYNTASEKLCTSTLSSYNNTDNTINQQNKRINYEKPSGHTTLWITIVIVFIGILGLAEGFRRFRVHQSQRRGRIRQFPNVPGDLL